MEELAFFLVLVAIVLAVAGPVAFILVLVLFNKLGNLEHRISRMEFKGYESPIKPAPASVEPKPPVVEANIDASIPQPPQVTTPVSMETAAAMDFIKKPVKKPDKDSNMEVKIGITVALVVGVITVIVGVGFFLRYIIENMTFPPIARVSLVAAGGFVALIIGEVTRRRDYGIVAKGMTALGFALLYAAVFSGNKVYLLIDTPWAFAAAIAITAAAMLYAVGLNEVLIAFLSLLGGYLSPILIVTEQVLAIQLFGYVLILSLGAMAAAAFRRWRAVNWMAFVGTFILYTLWFEDFYYSEQMATALLWLGIFGGMYLLLPIFHGLVKKLTARAEDVGLVVANSIVVFYYLWQILYSDYQRELALATAALGAAHLVIMIAARLRCVDDVKLQSALGVLGSAFITAAIPLYFARLQPVLIGWAIEAVVLTFIAIRYQSLWTRAISMIVAGLATAGLFYHLPLHNSAEFRFILNESFVTWIFVSLVIMACHALWRFIPQGEKDETGPLLAQVYFVWGGFLLAIGCLLEWYAHCRWQIDLTRASVGEANFMLGVIVIGIVIVLSFVVRPIPPVGTLVQTIGALLALIGAVYTAHVMTEVYNQTFSIFANIPFIIALLYVATVLIVGWLMKRKDDTGISRPKFSMLLILTSLILLWVLISEQIYKFWRFREIVSNWRFSAEMYMSVAWAIYAAVLLVLGFVFRTRGVRYLSMAIFAVLLGKIFIVDTATLRTEYRIAAFLTTGLVLVGVSFLYQFLKKKGFFETLENQMLIEINKNE